MDHTMVVFTCPRHRTREKACGFFPLPEDLQENNGSLKRKLGDSSLSRYRQLMITGRG